MNSTSIFGPGSGGWMQGESPVNGQSPEPEWTSTGLLEMCPETKAESLAHRLVGDNVQGGIRGPLLGADYQTLR